MTEYGYQPQTMAQLEHALRMMLPGGTMIKAPLQADFAGVDFDFTVNRRLPIAVRCRFDRPWYAPDTDISFRTTEPAKIAAGTYAPLAMFAWFGQGWLTAARLVDVYRMNERIDPTLAQRAAIHNGDGTAFVTVTFGELHDAAALLRTGDPRHGFGTACIGGMTRIEYILRTWKDSAPLSALSANTGDGNR